MLGFGLFAWLVVSLIAFGRRKLSSIRVLGRPVLAGALSSIVALLTVGLFAYPFQLPASALLFGMLAGVILANPDEPPHPFSDEGPIPIERISPLRVRKPEKGAVVFAARIVLALLSFLYLTFLARIYVSSLHLHRGTEYFLRREYQEAAAVFQQAIDANARDPEIHLALGRALLLSGNAQEAIRHFSFAEKGFNSPRLRQDLAGCYVTVGRSNQAEREYGEWDRHISRSRGSPCRLRCFPGEDGSLRRRDHQPPSRARSRSSLPGHLSLHGSSVICETPTRTSHRCIENLPGVCLTWRSKAVN
jgi:tetratricopeptide (TPR) repeat protein